MDDDDWGSFWFPHAIASILALEGSAEFDVSDFGSPIWLHLFVCDIPHMCCVKSELDQEKVF